MSKKGITDIRIERRRFLENLKHGDVVRYTANASSPDRNKFLHTETYLIVDKVERGNVYGAIVRNFTSHIVSLDELLERYEILKADWKKI